MNSTSSQTHIGLTTAQVEESRRLHGSNVLTTPQKEPAWRKYLKKLADPLIVILLVAGALSVGISIYTYLAPGEEQGELSAFFEPLGIFVAIFLATGMAFYFEEKANKEFDLLNQVNDDTAVQVWRDGTLREIPKKEVVVGDIVRLSTGDEIPSDGELIEAVSLHVDESTLTGEPICEKTTDPEAFDPEATFPSNHVMRGTKVMEGHAVYRTTAVGDQTENGKVFVAAQIDQSVKTPLSEQLEGLAGKISKYSYLLAALIVVGRLTVYFHQATFDWIGFLAELLQTLMVAVTLIVVAVPEGLPMAVTLSLAYSMRRMLKTNNLVRKMHACETMGATTVICTDKTGTLTQNQMRVDQTHFADMPGQMPTSQEGKTALIVEGICVNATATLDLSDPAKPGVLGNPTEGALMLWLYSHGVDHEAVKVKAETLVEVPFTTERKYMATVVRSAVTETVTLYVKGAPEIVMGLCRSHMTEAEISATTERLTAYQQQAMRTLGFAYKTYDSLNEAEADIKDGRVATESLCFLGFVAIADPVRADVPEAVKRCIDAGIAVKIVTGDTIATAREIGRQIGLWQEGDGEKNIITGPEFAALSDEELERYILDLKIIARARPMDKKRLVETLQKKGQVVAVTGDGTNDAPALKAAHVGLSMGDGTSVAKEASDITILDNSFSSIVRAVMWGRSLYQNIQRFILFQMTVNVVACLIVLIGAFVSTRSPITVTQMLWVNLIMDTFAAMALASLPPSESVMGHKPRKRTAFIINRPMRWGIGVTGVAFTLLLFGLLWLFGQYEVKSLTDFTHLSNVPLKTGRAMTDYEQSLFFTIFVMLQFWNMFNARAFATGKSAFHVKGCKGFVLIAFFILVGQLIITTFGGAIFNVKPINATDWLIIIGGTSMVLWVGEAYRLLKRKRIIG
ncbi:MAG: calcium-translocating P-type ATPase, PMCA-type [Alloprevotella sp.]